MLAPEETLIRIRRWVWWTVLAVQNMEATGIVPRAQEIEFKALEGSLSMMSKGKCISYFLLRTFVF